MSYDTAKPFNPEWLFSSGYVDNTPEHKLADMFSPYLRNARLDGNAIINRPWHSLHVTLTSGDYPRGLSSYLREDSANNVMLVRHNIDATHKLNTVTVWWTVVDIVTASNILSDNRMNFINVSDSIYCMNGSDDFWKLNWIAYTLPTTWITNFSPAFGVWFNSSLFVSWYAWALDKVYKSVWNDYENFSWLGSDSFDFVETITWLSSNLQALFYFTKNTISVTWVWDIQDIWWAINYSTRALTVKEWANNHNCIVNAWNNVFFITPSNKIARVVVWNNIDWFEVLELSERKHAWISKIMSTLDLTQDDAFGYFISKDNLVKWFLKSKWANFNDTCIIYDITKDCFLVDDNKYFYDWITFEGKNYTISTIEPKLFQDEFGTDDEWAAINFRYETKYFDLWIPTRKKELWESRTYVAINELAELKQNVVIDWNVIDTKIIDNSNIPISTGWIWTYAIGTAKIWTWWDTDDTDLIYVDLIRTKGNLQVKGKKIKFIYINNTVWGKIRLEDLEMKIEVLPPEATNLTK